MENIEKKMEELCIAMKNTKECQIKGELQLVSMNKTINFINEKFDEFEKDRREKDEIIKNLSKKPPSEMAQRIDKLENLVDRQEQYSRRNRLLVHESAETNNENTDDLVLKTINERLDLNIIKNEIDGSRRIGRKKNGQRSRPIIVKLTRCNTRKKVFASKRKLKGMGISITELLNKA